MSVFGVGSMDVLALSWRLVTLLCDLVIDPSTTPPRRLALLHPTTSVLLRATTRKALSAGGLGKVDWMFFGIGSMEVLGLS